ncbi:MAG TPA: type II CAAX endopeptidase family protein, partial [Casimicrobiaceae bacterium]|nr:type II CAAX endopeptidase family protein [Casimicrobiaceae bacterium]
MANGITRKPAFWVVYALVSLAALAVALRLFPLAIPIVNLDVRMSRGEAVAAARALAARLELAPAEARSAVRFNHDSETQNYIELEGGGKSAFAQLTRGGVYAPYWWEVRLFRPGAIDETVIRLRPDGRPDGFERRLPETYVRDPARKALAEAEARTIAEQGARDDFHVDLSAYRFLEHSQQTEPGGRVDHSFTYERPEALGEARVRLRLVVSGDELTGVTPFVHVPESFDRRFAELRSTNDLIANLAALSAGILYGIGGCVLGVLWLARRHWLEWKPAVVAGLCVGSLLALASLASAPTAWFGADTTQTVATFWARQAGTAVLVAVAGGLAYALTFMAAESLSRRAFPHQPQLWRLWSRDAGPTRQVAGRTLGGYLFVPIDLALIAAFYYATNRWLGWWQPSEVLTDPNILGSSVPAATPIAIALEAGFMEECVFRAIPLSLGALIGARYGRRGLGIALAVVLQAVVFGSAHANYPGLPAYSRPIELLLPSIVWALIFLRFGLLPTILLHATFDVSLLSIPVFLVDAPGARLQQALVILAAATPLVVILLRRLQAGAWGELPEALRNAGWRPAVPAPEPQPEPPSDRAAGPIATRFQNAFPWLGIAGLVAWAAFAPFRADVAPMTLDRADAITAADAALAARGVTLGPQWKRFAVVRLASDVPQQWQAHKFVWREVGDKAYRALVGGPLAPPVWEVRYATFGGDVVARAEEWRVTVASDRSVRTVVHELPEARAGARLSRQAAFEIAARELKLRFGVDAAKLQLVAADEQQRPARTDWSFVFGDPGVGVGKGGEARYAVAIGGDEVTAAGRFLHLPETWLRAERERDNRLQVLALAGAAIFLAAGLAALIVGIRRWVRHRVNTRALRWVMVASFALTVLGAVNGWPVVAMQLSTTDPVASQLAVKLVAGIASALAVAL